MRPDFQCDPTARHRPEHFTQRVRSRPDALFQLDLAGFIQHAVPTVAISQIQSDGQCLPRKFLPCFVVALLSFFIVGLLFICALSTSITWERTASRRRPAFSSHLFTAVRRRIGNGACARSGWIVLLFLMAVLPAASQATLTKPTASEPTPKPAIPAILAAFDRYEVVAMPEAHGMKDLDDFILSLIRDPVFAVKVMCARPKTQY
jgi:hypothetical protein